MNNFKIFHDGYASICGELLRLAQNWGWEAVERKFNPNFHFKRVHIVCFNSEWRYRLLKRGCLYIHQIPRLPFKLFKFPPFQTLLLVRHAIKIIRQYQISLITNFYSHILDDGIPTVLAGMWTGIPSVVTVQNDYHQLLKTTSMYLRNYYLNNLLESYVYRNATHIRCVSQHLVKYVTDHGISENKITFIPRCLDPTIFTHPSDLEVTSFMEKYGIQDIKKGTVMLCVGKLNPQKNIERTLNAFAHSLDKTMPLHLLIAGDGILKAELQKTAKDLNIDHRVTFLGKISQFDLRCAYSLSDIFLLPSLFEGRSRAILEALSYGLPVIVSNIESTREIIEHEFNGFLIDPLDIHSISQAITRLVESEDLRIKLARNAIQTIKDQYSARDCYERKANFINSLITEQEIPDL